MKKKLLDGNVVCVSQQKTAPSIFAAFAASARSNGGGFVPPAKNVWAMGFTSENDEYPLTGTRAAFASPVWPSDSYQYRYKTDTSLQATRYVGPLDFGSVHPIDGLWGGRFFNLRVRNVFDCKKY